MAESEKRRGAENQQSLTYLFDVSPLRIESVPLDKMSVVSTYLQAIDGIGAVLEERLHSAGIDSWSQLENAPHLLARNTRARILHSVSLCQTALKKKDIEYLAARLPRTEHWRLAAAFPDMAVFLDIETTGLSRVYHRITAIGWAHNGDYEAVTQPTKMDVKRLNSRLSTAKILVTYNGSHFDVPFLRSHVPDLTLPRVHVDLRHLGQRIGLVGGQKKIENQLGLERAPGLQQLTGENAPALWFRYLRGDTDALRLLLEYNHADVDGLRILLENMVGRMDDRVPYSWAVSDFSSWLTKDANRGQRRVLKAYRGKRGPHIKYNDLNPRQGLRVVGIDLTGSSKRATGWALTVGKRTTTARFSTDEEIVGATIDARPDIVSIDAPLSLPFGRETVRDDDPARDEFGITRYAERVLRSRGVNTYPALIKSMQGLTARGISLASRLREQGVPVIESFPGAMQDILGMPRKGMSLAELKYSLKLYGLQGDFLASEVTHDEIDAISSAIVGHFFSTGLYEALGNEDEDYMIVPSLDSEKKTTQQIIGLTGPIAAGKTTLASLLESSSYTRVRYSEIISDLYPNSGSLPKREHLRAVGAYIHNTGKQRWLNQQLLKRVSGASLVVVDGLRYPEDYAALQEHTALTCRIVYIDAPRSVREQRFDRRHSGINSFAVAESDQGEAAGAFLKKNAHLIYENSGTIDDIESFASQLAKRQEER